MLRALPTSHWVCCGDSAAFARRATNDQRAGGKRGRLLRVVLPWAFNFTTPITLKP
ncbi:MAG: hypothetical protein U0521_13395 [Anaerolineae bacterium]